MVKRKGREDPESNSASPAFRINYDIELHPPASVDLAMYAKGW
jgi:hypothetical protein